MKKSSALLFLFLTSSSLYIYVSEAPSSAICPECQVGFSQGYNLTVHLREQHSECVLYHCPESGCNFTTKRYSNLKQHHKSRRCHPNKTIRRLGVWKNLKPALIALILPIKVERSQEDGDDKSDT